MNSNIRLSVITVVLNAADRIENTIDSVLSQDYENIEYIIKDGGSSDGTLDIIKRYTSRDSRIKLFSGPDEGIYYAMNEALSYTTGEAVHFLNAGDRFSSSDVVSRALSTMIETDFDIVYGDVIYENADGSVDIRTYPQASSRRLYYLTGDCINHQCMFVKKALFNSGLFDTSFRICADREWMLRIGAYTPNLKMKALGFTVATYPLDGISVKYKALYSKEASLCIRKHMPWGYHIYRVFEFLRSNKYSAYALHGIYNMLFTRRI